MNRRWKRWRRRRKRRRKRSRRRGRSLANGILLLLAKVIIKKLILLVGPYVLFIPNLIEIGVYTAWLLCSSAVAMAKVIII